MRRRLALAVLLPTLATVAVAEPLPELIERVKPSVVLVGSYGLLDSPRFGFRGTGFVVGDGRLVMTNAHVIPPETPGRVDRGIAVQTWSREGQWQIREAKLLTSDPFRDLAILRIDGPALSPVKLAAADVREGATIALMGFPLAGALGFSHVTHRGIVASRTSIAQAASNFQGLSERSVRQLRQGVYEILQLDANAYPGNSGGPVFDLESGEVVGIVNMVMLKAVKEAAISAASGITYAIPARDAQALLNTVK
jgi:S1-C subfamily serine protease